MRGGILGESVARLAGRVDAYVGIAQLPHAARS
jgi:hypothetical protein